MRFYATSRFPHSQLSRNHCKKDVLQEKSKHALLYLNILFTVLKKVCVRARRSWEIFVMVVTGQIRPLRRAMRLCRHDLSRSWGK